MEHSDFVHPVRVRPDILSGRQKCYLLFRFITADKFFKINAVCTSYL
ncbi:hypothetical protein KAS42_01825 [bacterium]|nr:hypothetical protein [bacterium]